MRHKTCAHLANRGPVIFAEIGNRLVIGRQPTREPHHLDIASSLALKAPARLNPIEVAVDVQLQQDRWMVRRPSGCLGIDSAEPKLGKIQLANKDVDRSNWIVLTNPIFQVFREERALAAIQSLNEAPHLLLPRISSRESHEPAFSHSQGQTRTTPQLADVGFPSGTDNP